MAKFQKSIRPWPFVPAPDAGTPDCGSPSGDPAGARSADELAVTNEDFPVDVDLIREACEAGLDPGRPSPVPRDRLDDFLRGGIGLLVPEVAEAAPSLTGEWQGAAEHVLERTDDLTEDASTTDLAYQCRALLYLHAHHTRPEGRP